MKVRSAVILGNLLSLLLLAGVIFYFREPLTTAYFDLEQRFIPCHRPIAYSIGSVDQRFGLSAAKFEQAVKTSADVWAGPLSRPMFVEAPSGSLKINLVYDYRQEATVKLRQMGLTINHDQQGYDALHEKYRQMKDAYGRQKTAYDVAAKAIDVRRQALQAETDSWNAHGGAPRQAYDRLTAEQTALNKDIDQLNAAGASLNQSADQLNAVGVTLNQLASELNLKADQFNDVADTRGRVFEEGQFASGPEGDAINVYEFENQTQLVRLLIHELGHALGLEHSDNPQDVMYRLNQGATEKLSPRDVTALQDHCRPVWIPSH